MAIEQIDSLTPREREILSLIAEGDSLSDIARKLHRSLKTIETHRLSLGRKLNATNRVELARIAIASGLVSIGSEPISPPGDGSKFGAERELNWLSAISEAVNQVSGRRYIDRLCVALTQVLGVRFAAVCMIDPDSRTSGKLTVAYSERGNTGQPFTCDPANKPAQTVLEQGVCRVTSGIAKLYPHDARLIEHGIESFMGIRLDDDRGISAGILAIWDDKPMQEADTLERILRFFASRTIAELESAYKAEQMIQLQRQIEQQSPTPSDLPGQDHAGSNKVNELLKIRQSLDSLAGTRFLSALTDTLCESLGVSHAGVCVQEMIEDRPGFFTISLSEHGVQAEFTRYLLEHSPCEITIANGSYCLSGGRKRAFSQG